MTPIIESDVEAVALSCLVDSGWCTAHGPGIDSGASGAEHTTTATAWWRNICVTLSSASIQAFPPRFAEPGILIFTPRWKCMAADGSLLSTMTQEEFDAILADETKEILGNIVWNDDTDHSPAQEFRAEVNSDAGYPMFIQGRYNPLAGKLTFAVILRGEGRIYGLDLGADHRNPDGAPIGDKHKNYWREGYRDKWAYVPPDITKPWNRPVEVWQQFCTEARLRHRGMMLKPATQVDLPL